MTFMLTLNIFFGIILITMAVTDLLEFKDKTISEVGGGLILKFILELFLGSFLVVITLITVGEYAARLAL